MPFTVLFTHDQFLFDDTLEVIYKDLIENFPKIDSFEFKNCSYRNCLAISVQEQVDAIAVIAFEDSEGTVQLFQMLQSCPLTKLIPSVFLFYENQTDGVPPEVSSLDNQEPPPLPYFRRS